MNELQKDSPFELDHGSSGLVLVDENGRDLTEGIANGQIELTVDTDLPETSSSKRRKTTRPTQLIYDDDYEYTSTMKYFKRHPGELEGKEPTLSPGKSEIRLVQDISSQDGNYYISMIPRPDSDILGDHFVTEESSMSEKEGYESSEEKDDSRHNGMLLLNKGNLSLCSVKENDKDDHGDLKISVSLPMGIPVSGGDITLTVPTSALTGGAAMKLDNLEQDPVDHSYYRAGNTKESNVDPVRTTWVTTKADKAQLKQNGHTWRTGKWTTEEVDLLKCNIDKYCKENGIKDVQQIIFHATKDERKNFYPTISAGLNRPVFAVYRRVKRMYDRQNYKGRYSQEEVKQLKDLKAKHGRDWSLIGQQMGRSSDSIKDRCRLFKDDELVSGKWSDEEEIRLAQAVFSVTGKKPGTFVTENITWSSVSKLVGTRTEKQCRRKWLNYLNWKLCNGEEWRKTDDKLLIERIIESNADSEEDIEWQKLTEGWSSVRSPQWLRCKWGNLKKLFHHAHPDIETISLKELLKDLLQIVNQQIANSWERYEHYQKITNKISRRKGPKRSVHMDDKTSDNSESNIAAAKLEEDARSSYLSNLRPDTVYAVANGNLEENMEMKVVGTLPVSHQKDVEGNDHEMTKMTNAFISSEQLKNDHAIEVEPKINLGAENTFELNSTSTPGVYVLQNSDTTNQMVLLVSDNMQLAITPDALTLLNRATKGETSISDEGQGNDDDVIDHQRDNHDVMSPPNHHIDITATRSDVITTSDVLVYQETSNDDDIKNPILSSAIHEVVTERSHDNDDDCFIQSSSPLQGTLLEGTDLATSTIRIDDPH